MIDKLLVDMPKKKIYKQKRYGNKIYVYYTTRAYRNDKGKPTSDSVMIGTEDTETGKLIPNENFFKYFDCDVIINVKGEKTNR